MYLLTAACATVDPFLPCFVLGCYQEATIGAVHSHRGRVQACPDHHPARTGQARLLGRIEAPEAVQDATPQAPTMSSAELLAALMKEVVRLSSLGDSPSSTEDTRPDGGTKATLRKPRPTRPSGGIALAQ